MSSSKKLVSVIVLAEAAPKEIITDALNTVFNQTHQHLDVIVGYFKRDDLNELKERWRDRLNINWVECTPEHTMENKGVDLFGSSLKAAKGEIVFYKSMQPVFWFPRHIEHHLELLEYDSKAKWSFSFVELKNWKEKESISSTINWRIDKSPKVEHLVIEDICHYTDVPVDWSTCLYSSDNGKTIQFVPGLILNQFKNIRVAIPEEITLQQWIDPQQQVVELGKPVSNQSVNEEVVEDENGQLAVKVEFPTVVGSIQWNDHNKVILERIKGVDPNSVKRIALKRTIGMGDVLLVEPVIKSFRNKYPNAHITLFTSKTRGCAEIVQYFVNKPDETIGFDNEQFLTQDFLYTQKRFDLRYDLDLSYESRRNVNYIDGYYQTVGIGDEIINENGKLVIVHRVKENEKIPQLVYDKEAFIKEKYIAVELAGSGWPGKEWDLNNWENILADSSLKKVFVSNLRIPPTAAIPSNIVNVNNDFDIMLNYLRYCEYYIGADNGPMHIAAAFGKKCFVVAGAATPAFTTKNKNVSGITKKGLNCLHCKGRQFINDNGQGGYTFVAQCENQDQYACMKKLEVGEVLEQYKQFKDGLTIN